MTESVLGTTTSDRTVRSPWPSPPPRLRTGSPVQSVDTRSAKNVSGAPVASLSTISTVWGPKFETVSLKPTSARFPSIDKHVTGPRTRVPPRTSIDTNPRGCAPDGSARASTEISWIDRSGSAPVPITAFSRKTNASAADTRSKSKTQATVSTTRTGFMSPSSCVAAEATALRRRATRRCRVRKYRAARALDLLELIELAWHDCYGDTERSPERPTVTIEHVYAIADGVRPWFKALV